MNMTLRHPLPSSESPTPMKSAPMKSAIVLMVLGGGVAFAAVTPDLGTVTLKVQEAATGQTLPARVHLHAAGGRAVRAPGLPFWHDHFVCAGEVTLELAPGTYAFEIERGPEWTVARGDLVVQAGSSQTIAPAVTRLVDPAAEGWWSGDLHVHRGLADAELLMRAEDLRVAQFTTWWNQANAWKDSAPPRQRPVKFDGNRYFDPLAGEDERDGGALLYFNLERPLDITAGTRHYPSSLEYALEARQRGGWIELEKPFWWDLPMWLAHGIGDSVGIAHNHLQRGGVLDNEAWGRPRDRVRFPGPQGNGGWTQEIYYHLLNCGLRLPPSAGSASGVLPNPVGYNRVYVHVAGELSWDKWWEGLRAGRCFVGNGPLLRVRANGQYPGHVFKSDGPLAVSLDVRLDSRDPIRAVEWVRNGQVERVPFPSLVTLHESGWFLVRAIADVTNTLRFASTGPWYVEIGEPARPVRAESAEFFAAWTRERTAGLERVAELDAARKEAVLAPWRETAVFWSNRLVQAQRPTLVTGRLVDDATGQPIPGRVYIQRADGRWSFPTSAVPSGSAVRYERRNWANTNAVEYHTTLSAHPFRAALEPGRYTFTAERGKEYRPLVREVEVGIAPPELELRLVRWINLAARGWYSGDTHVHRSLEELPNVMLAEELNVAFPLTYWVTKGFAPPTQGDRAAGTETPGELVRVDATHAIWPRNTEWEIFTLNGRSHTLGAVFALGHREPFPQGAPPVGPIAERARREGALLDLDKHDWPWSMVLPPVMGVDLFELANNHHWRTEFGITRWSTQPPVWMGLTTTPNGGDERAWTLYGFQNYYALLNCGFRLRPTAGTASGVHPVPLGFSRVYVHLPEGFSYAGWLRGLRSGRSFVTTGPMLFCECRTNEVRGTVVSEEPVTGVEVVVNGVVTALDVEPQRNADGAWEAAFRRPLNFEGTRWVAVRCFEERSGGRFRFAHTAPEWFDVPDRPLRPRREEVAFLKQRVRDELERSRALLPPAALAEYQQALEAYERLERAER